MKKLFLAAALLCIFFNVTAQENEWGIGASFGMASKTVKWDKYRLEEKSNQISAFVDRNLSDHFGATAEFDVYIPYKTKTSFEGYKDAKHPDFNLFLAPTFLLGDKFFFGLAAGPLFSFQKCEYAVEIKTLFYASLGAKMWIGYAFNDDWGIFINNRYEFDFYTNGYSDIVQEGWGFSFGGFNLAVGFRYSF